eukprot:m.190163 g.190163  ORF g.190163 m.190163 type:complete len:271 (+) comp32395_c0_seq2:395-1207(+)
MVQRRPLCETLSLVVLLINVHPSLQVSDSNVQTEFVCSHSTVFAATRGNAKAQYNLGLCYLAGDAGFDHNTDKALQWMERAAEQGFILAQHHVAVMFDQQNEIDHANSWYHEAANNGHANSQFNLGVNYKDGIGVKQNERESLSWFEAAAEQGHTDAAFICARHYGKGIGVKQNMRIAFKWFRVAAHGGHEKAQFNLAMFYHRGLGVDIDIHAAFQWYKVAADGGNAGAQGNMESLTREYPFLLDPIDTIGSTGGRGNTLLMVDNDNTNA